ncbi:MAG: transcription elongation factor GreA [Ruminococcaceae bacterium]|nr:transcription elongation factor GreA [Oscillospiraceae bacterium]
MYNELTEVDIKKLTEELEERRRIAPSLREALREARELGDLSENEEYRHAKRENNRNNSRIRFLENMIRTAIIIKTDSNDNEVGLFDRVTIYYEDDDEERVIRIVTTLRNDVLNDCISKDSPFGKAVLGKKVGDRVTVKVNERYSYSIVIRAIEKGEDDYDLPIQTY